MFDYAALFNNKLDPTDAVNQVKKWKTNAQKAAAKKAGNPYDAPAVYESSATAQQNQLKGWLQGMEQDRELIQSIRDAHGLTDRDNVQIFVVPRGQNRIQPGSVIMRPTTSPRLQEITRTINSATGRIRELEIGTYGLELTEEEKARMKNSLRNSLTQNRRALERERARIATLPRTGWIVVERD